MKAGKEKLQIFSMRKRPSEMEIVPQKITLRDKLALSSQILAQVYPASMWNICQGFLNSMPMMTT